MKFIDNIDKDEYEEFVSHHKTKSHFMQSYYFGEVMKYKNYTPHYVGMKDGNKLVATALMLKKALPGGFCYYYSPRGYVMDFNNFKLLEEFTDNIKVYAKKNNALYVKIDPDIKRHTLDIDGNIVDGEKNYKLMDELKKLGYKHQGFGTDFIYEEPRFTFRLNLDDEWDNIYSRMHATTRKILNRKNQYDLDTYIGTEKDIPDFYITMEETAQREGIACNPIKYYQEFYKILHDQGMSDLYVVKVDIKHLKDIYQNKIKDIEANIKIEEERKHTGKVNDLKNELAKAQKEYDAIKDMKNEKRVLSSIITVKYNDKVWTIHGGNTTDLRELNSNYWLYYTIIKDAHDQGYKVIDFFGTSGNPNPPKDNPVYGIHNFKKRLGGEYTEFIGEYDLIINPFMYFVYKVIVPIRRKIVHKMLIKKAAKK